MRGPEQPGELEGQLERLQGQLPADPAGTWAALQALRTDSLNNEVLNEGVLARVLVLQGRALCLQGQYSLGLEAAQQALTLARRVGAGALEAQALSDVGLARQRLGDLAGAMTAFLDGLRLGATQGDEAGVGRALLNIASIHVRLGDSVQALALHEQALESARTCENAELTVDALTRLLEDHFLLGHDHAVLNLTDETLTLAQQHGLTGFECAARRVQSQCLLRLGRVRAALITAQTGLRVAVRARDREAQLALNLAVGQAFLALGEARLSLGFLQDGLTQAEDWPHRDMQWQFHQALTQVFVALQDERRAAYHRGQWQALHAQVYGPDVQERTRQLASQAVQAWQERPVTPRTWTAHTWTQELDALTEQLRATRSELALAASQDALTGVPHRSHFQGRAQQHLNLLTVGERVGFVLLSLDHMKSLNARFGHAWGDRALVEFARRLEGLLRPGDLVGRQGGDEFVIMLADLNSPEDISRVMGRLLSHLRAPLTVQEQTVNLSVSLGGAVFPDDGTSVEELFRNADLALGHAREGGRNQGQRFEPIMRVQEQRRRTLLFELHGAAERGELRLYYQGQFSLPGRTLKGFEALVRWQHPELGLVPPAEFIPLAEESRLIVDVGAWVLREACRQAQEWGFPQRKLRMAVNVSALQVEDAAFPALVQGVLMEFKLPGRTLVLELTESMMHRNPGQAGQVIRDLQHLGVQVALDDFGAGFSSLSSLQTLALNQLKIDRSFLGELSHGAAQLPRARLLVDMMVNLAHNMSMDVVAEGVEQDEQLRLLTELHCDGVQGYLLARPQPPQVAQGLLN